MAWYSGLLGGAKTTDAAAPVASQPTRTRDGIVNAAARLGIGADNVQSGASYSYTTVSRNRQNLDNAYRGSWLVGMGVDAVADDMCRAGITMMGDIPPKDIEAIEKEFTELSLWQKLANTARWARLYGGAIAVLLIDGQNPSTPLRIDTIRKGQFRGLLVFDRWMVNPSLTDLVTEFGADMGQPRFYQVNASEGGTYGPDMGQAAMGRQAVNIEGAVNIHYTRCIRLDGNELPFFARQAEQGWGQSVLERLYDRLLAYDSATQGAAQLVYKAHLRTLRIAGLREAIAFGGKALEGLAAQVDFIRKFQTSDGLTMLDAEDNFETHQYAFAGLPELLNQFSEQLSGALQIPLVRLFGQSPAGFSTGDTDLQNYYDMIQSQQESKLRRPVGTLLEVVSRSKLGKALPPGFGYEFTSLWEMTAEQKAEIASKITTAVVAAAGAQLISQKVGMEELRQAGHQTGIFSNISDEDIANAESEPPSPDEALNGIDPATGQPPNPGEGQPGQPGAAGPERAAGGFNADDPSTASHPVARTSDEGRFEEAKHKRNHGKFSSTGGAGAAPKAAPAAKADGGKQDAPGQPQDGPRATGGRAPLVMAEVKDGKRVAPGGGPLPAHIEKLKLPPAWSGVKYAEDAGADLLAQGKDVKGRVQSVYSAEFSAKQAAAKFARVESLIQQYGDIQKQNAAAQKSADPKTKDAADCLDLVMKTGVRPGSDTDTGAEKQAYGATTLQGQHVVSDADGTYLRFTGKKGVSLNLKINDPELTAMLTARAKAAGPEGQLFPNVTDKSLLDHSHTMGDGSFKSKDFRTHLGTTTAARLVNSMKPPTSPKEHKAAVMEVARQVSEKLGNTATIALQSYISPTVFSVWEGARG